MTTHRGAAMVVLVVAQAFWGCGPERYATPLAPSNSVSPPVTPVPGSVVRGFVQDTAFRPLAGARVESFGAEGERSATSDGNGQFWLSGSFDPTTVFRASSEGHLMVTGTLDPRAGGWISFRLAAEAAPVDVAGDYEITFTAGSCPSLPPEAKTRTYAATISPTTTGIPGWVGIDPRTAFDLVIDRATVQNDGISAIGVAGNIVAFAFFVDGLPYIVEEIAPERFVAITGHAETSIDRSDLSNITATFAGWIEHLDYNPLVQRGGRALARCESKTHQIIMMRR